jgi:hypothetical protein
MAIQPKAICFSHSLAVAARGAVDEDLFGSLRRLAWIMCGALWRASGRSFR